MFLGHALRQQGKLEDARQAFLTASHLSDEHPVVMAELGHIHATLGERSEALQILERLNSPKEGHYVSPHMIAHVHLGFGDKERAIGLLEETFAERGAYLIFLTTDAVYDLLRGIHAFENLVRRVGFITGP